MRVDFVAYSKVPSQTFAIRMSTEQRVMIKLDATCVQTLHTCMYVGV